MRAIGKALKAVYDFFCGDAILLLATAVAFAAAAVLRLVAHASSTVAIIVFVCLVVAGLVTTLARERVG